MSGTVYNVRHYGAAGDGATDDTAAIQAALTAATAAGGGIVYLPPGTYLVTPTTTNWLKVGSDTIVCGAGSSSIVRVTANAGNYPAIFSAATTGTHVNRVTFRNFTIDQNPAANTTCDITAGTLTKSLIAILFFNFTEVIVDRMRFDSCCGINTVDLNAANGLRAVVRDCYFRFVAGTTTTASGEYDNSAIYLSAVEQIVTGNIFEAAVVAGTRARACIEIHAGPGGVVTGNVSRGYETLCNVTTQSSGTALADSDFVIANNTLVDGLHGVLLWAYTGYTLRNVVVTGNTIKVNNADRAAVHSAAAVNSHHGIAFVNDSSGVLDGDFENIIVRGNVITFQSETRAGYAFTDSGGILAYARGSLTNIITDGNVIQYAPTQGIRVHSSTGQAHTIAVTNNRTIDCGNNASATSGLRCHILLSGVVSHGSQVIGNSLVDSNAGALVGVNGINASGVSIPTSGQSGLTIKDNPIFVASFTAGHLANNWSTYATPEAAFRVTIGGAYTISAGEYSRYEFTLDAASPAFTLTASSATTLYERLRLTFINTSGGAGPVITFGTAGAWKMAAWANPATGFRRTLEVEHDGSNNWREVWRGQDVPN